MVQEIPGLSRLSKGINETDHSHVGHSHVIPATKFPHFSPLYIWGKKCPPPSPLNVFEVERLILLYQIKRKCVYVKTKAKVAIVIWCQCGTRSNPCKSDDLKSRLLQCYTELLYSSLNRLAHRELPLEKTLCVLMSATE